MVPLFSYIIYKLATSITVSVTTVIIVQSIRRYPIIIIISTVHFPHSILLFSIRWYLYSSVYDTRLYLLHNIIRYHTEYIIYIISIHRWCFYEYHTVRICIVLCFFKRYFSPRITLYLLVLQIILVPNQCNDHLSISIHSRLFQPLHDILIRVSIGDIVHKQPTSCIPIVRSSNGLECLLACSIPYL